MTVLRSWGNRLFGMECLSLSLSFGPAIQVQDGIKKVEVLYLCESQRTGRLFFFFSFSCLLLHLTLFLSYCPLFFCSKRKRKQANEGKKGGGELYRRKKQTSPYKKNKKLARSSMRGQGYQSKSTSATTQLLFQIKTTYGRQTTSAQDRNPKRLADQPTETLYSSLLVSPQRQASTHPSFTVKIVFSFSFLYLMLFSFLTHWQWGPDICRVHLKKKMCQGSVIPLHPLSLPLSLFH